MRESLSPRQLYAFCLTALSAPAVTVCAGLPWPWVLAVSVLAAALELGLLVLWRRAGAENLPHLALQAWGKPVGTALLAAAAVFVLLLLWRFVRGTDSAFPDDDTLPFVPLVLLAVTAWAAWHGRAAVIRAVGVLFFFVAALYAAVFFFALPDVQLQRLRSWESDVSLVPAAVLLLPTFGLYLTRPQQRRRKLPLWWLLVLIMLPAAVAALCAAVPGSRGSFYEMAKSIEVLSVAQRLEPLVSALLTVGWFAAISLLVLSVGEMADAAGLPARWASVGVCVLAAPGCVWNLAISDGILAIFGAVFCVIFPLVTLAIVARKKL